MYYINSMIINIDMYINVNIFKIYTACVCIFIYIYIYIINQACDQLETKSKENLTKP